MRKRIRNAIDLWLYFFEIQLELKLCTKTCLYSSSPTTPEIFKYLLYSSMFDFLNNQIRIKDISEGIRLQIHANVAWLVTHYVTLNTGTSEVQWLVWDAVVVRKQLILMR